ncbi:MAG: HTH domain-containing protein [Haloglomus sp.]
MRIRPVPPAGTHVELYVQSLSPTETRTSQESRLRKLQRSDAVDSVEVVVTGDRICPETVAATTEVGSVLLEKFEQFERWAAETDRTLGPAFRRETGQSLLTGASISGACFPDCAMAEYRDGTLSFVAPCRDGEREWSVPERVAELVSGAEPGGSGVSGNRHA